MSRVGAATRRLFREPLVQFLLAGATLFLLYEVSAGGGSERNDRIVVDAGRSERLAAEFARTWMRPPTRAELDGLIQDFVTEEVLYREALALGLDRDDLVVRRRMRQKMEFLNDDLAENHQPTDAELQAFLDANSDKYRRPARLGFVQVFVGSEGRAPEMRIEADRLLAQLKAEPAAAAIPGTLGRPSLLPDQLKDATWDEIEAIFGRAFAAALELAPLDVWAGPFESSYGLHLVRVTLREPGSGPPLAEIRSDVEREWSYQQRQRARQAFYEILRERYDVSIEMPEDEAGPELSARSP